MRLRAPASIRKVLRQVEAAQLRENAQRMEADMMTMFVHDSISIDLETTDRGACECGGPRFNMNLKTNKPERCGCMTATAEAMTSILSNMDSIREKGEPISAAIKTDDSLKKLREFVDNWHKPYEHTEAERRILDEKRAQIFAKCECGVEKVHGPKATAKMHSDYCPRSRA